MKGLMTVNKVLRSPRKVIYGRTFGNPQKTVERRVDLTEMNRSVRDFAAQTIGRSDDLSRPETTTRDQAATDTGPMIPSGVFIDLWGSAKFAPRDHGNVLVHPTLVEVLNQSGEALIEVGQVRVSCFAEVPTVKIPTPKIECHHSNASLNKSSGHEEVLTVPGGTVAVTFFKTLTVTFPYNRILLGEVKRLRKATRRQNIQRLLLDRIETFHRARSV